VKYSPHSHLIYYDDKCGVVGQMTFPDPPVSTKSMLQNRISLELSEFVLILFQTFGFKPKKSSKLTIKNQSQQFEAIVVFILT